MKHVGAFVGGLVAALLYAVLFAVLPGSLVVLLLLWVEYPLSVALQFVSLSAMTAGVVFAARDVALYYTKDDVR